MVGTTCWLLDLPAAFSLGFLSGVLTVLPLIGVVVGGIPALLLAFGLEGWTTTLWLLAVLLVLQTIEATVLEMIRTGEYARAWGKVSADGDTGGEE